MDPIAVLKSVDPFILLMDLFVLAAVQLTVAFGLFYFHLRQEERVRMLEDRLAALERQDTVSELGPRPRHQAGTSAGLPHRAAEHPTRAAAGPAGRVDPALRSADRSPPSRPEERRITGADELGAEAPFQRILRLAEAGRSSVDIARATGRGRGEVDLLLHLYRLEREANAANIPPRKE